MLFLIKIFAVFFLLFSPAILFPQSSSPGKPGADTTTLLDAFRKGKTTGHFRMFYMSTNNRDPLTDYYALAFGGGLKYETRSYRGFQAGVGGFFIWNLSSSDLTQPDPLTDVMNRYEIGQFDQEDPVNKKDLQRLEDFYIRYNYKNSFIRFGKQVIKTPFINPQDGRMRPTGEQGFWTEINEIKKTKVELGWLTHISPRGTMRWYRGAASIGIYPSGVSISGKKSDYKNQLDSRGTAVAGITYKVSENLTLQGWNHWVDNIFNTVLLQADAGIPLSKKRKLITGFQYIHQEAIQKGGHPDPAHTYFDPGQQVNILSGRVGYRNNNSTARINFTRITRHGRFLFPREWGREPLYTFLPRERNEGLGDVKALTINLLRDFPKQRLKTELSAGYYDLPDVKNYRLNKYGFPSYFQVNLDLKYAFDGVMNGLNAELLYLYKKRKGNIYNDWKYAINKVDMHQVNLIFNFVF